MLSNALVPELLIVPMAVEESTREVDGAPADRTQLGGHSSRRLEEAKAAVAEEVAKGGQRCQTHHRGEH